MRFHGVASADTQRELRENDSGFGWKGWHHGFTRGDPRELTSTEWHTLARVRSICEKRVSSYVPHEHHELFMPTPGDGAYWARRVWPPWTWESEGVPQRVTRWDGEGMEM